MKVIIATLLAFVCLSGDAQAGEYYGVQWPDDLESELSELNYNAEQISGLMHRVNDKCSKRVLNVVEKKSKVCIEYRCGIVKKYVNIDKYENSAEAESVSACGWL